MFDGLLLFRSLSPILSESVMTEPDTMTYIRAGSCVRTCSSIRIYVWPDAAQFENLGELVKNTIFVA